MPPENTNPVAKTESSELEFDAPPPANPRMRKRNLKVKPAAESIPAEIQPAVYAQPASATHSAPNGPVYVRPSGTAERTQPAPASGVLYYSSNPGTKKEESMKSIPHQQAATRPASAGQSMYRPTTSSAQPVASRPSTTTAFSPRPAAAVSTPQHTSPRPTAAAQPSMTNSSTTSHHASASSRPANAGSASSPSRAVSTSVSGASTSSRPAGVSDFRGNIERQSREQKSIGSILNVVVYVLVGFFLFAGLLAAYGAHDVYKQLHAQSTTVSELDARYSAANQDLTNKLATTQAGIQQIQSQLSHSQELLLRQQDLLTKMQSTLDAQAQALREERATRAAETSIREQETSTLRSRVRSLEVKNAAYHP